MDCFRDSITVIIPMYNSERTILGTLDSICNQTTPEYIREIIVVNDGSTDGSQELVESYLKSVPIKIRLLKKINGGVSSARNVGIRSADTEWIAFCDSDDIWLPQKIEKQVKVLQDNDVDLLGCNHQNKELKILTKKITKLHKATLPELCIKMYPQTSTIIVKKEICEEFGGFDEKQKYAEDGNLFMKIAYKYNYYYMPEQLVVFDGGRRGFGISGLSSNLKGMHEGNLKNLSDLEEKGYINRSYGTLLRVFYWIKYVRRLMIVKVSK